MSESPNTQRPLPRGLIIGLIGVIAVIVIALLAGILLGGSGGVSPADQTATGLAISTPLLTLSADEQARATAAFETALAQTSIAATVVGTDIMLTQLALTPTPASN